MNYEELLSEKQSKTSRPMEMPWGTFGKQLIDKKYLNVVELRKDLVVEPKFLECLDHESIEMLSMKRNPRLVSSVTSKRVMAPRSSFLRAILSLFSSCSSTHLR